MTRRSGSPVAARMNPRDKAVFPAPRSPSSRMSPVRDDDDEEEEEEASSPVLVTNVEKRRPPISSISWAVGIRSSTADRF